MDVALSRRLLDINREFYSVFADSFSATRSRPWTGFSHLLPYIQDGCHVLDVGCGNGRLAGFLDTVRKTVCYLGVDSSPRLVELAQERADTLGCVSASYRMADVTSSDWTDAMRVEGFDVVVALGLLQHIPGVDLRQRIIRQAGSLLSPGGVLLVSNWQFRASQRLRERIVPWSRVGIDPTGLERGDYLLDWRRDGVGYRYCHQLTEDEVAILASAANLQVSESIYADGPQDNLNLYSVLGPVQTPL